MKPVAFQGVHGANSEVAAKNFFGAKTATLPCERFDDVFDAVEQGRARFGIIPIENSLAGSIHQNYDLLLSRSLTIVAETALRLDHALLAGRGVELGDLRYVRSHPQALAQCSDFFQRHRRITPVPFFDTAGAAESLTRTPEPHTGAIANIYAARRFGLRILRRKIQNRENNVTRFLLLSRTQVQRRWKGRTKTSIVFEPVANQVGILFRILGVFALREIDLLKIESRPDPRSPFNYLFYLDLAGNPSQPKVARALEHLKEMVNRFKLLGVYPRSV